MQCIGSLSSSFFFERIGSNELVPFLVLVPFNIGTNEAAQTVSVIFVQFARRILFYVLEIITTHILFPFYVYMTNNATT